MLSRHRAEQKMHSQKLIWYVRCKRQTSAMWARIIVLRLSFEIEVENWRLTRRDLLHQYFSTLPACSLKLKTFSITKYLSVVCLMCSCFLDIAKTLLTSNQPTQPVIVFLHFFLSEKNLEAPLKSRQIWKAI